MTRHGRFLTALLGAAHAQDAPGQPSGRSGMSTSDPLNNVNAYADLSFFGRCLVSGNRNRAFALIATQQGSLAETELFRTWMTGEQQCLHGGTRTTASHIYMRGVIAEALIRHVSDMPANLTWSAIQPGEIRSLPDVGRCYVAANRQEAVALLQTRLGSAEELAAVTALWPRFNACMARAPRVRLNAPWIRFLIAEGVLRVPAQVAGAATAN